VHNTIKQSKVPIAPRKQMIPIFSKKCNFLKLYPAAKIMGGSIKVKNI
jgi:hypothetical protein